MYGPGFQVSSRIASAYSRAESGRLTKVTEEQNPRSPKNHSTDGSKVAADSVEISERAKTLATLFEKSEYDPTRAEKMVSKLNSPSNFSDNIAEFDISDQLK